MRKSAEDVLNEVFPNNVKAAQLYGHLRPSYQDIHALADLLATEPAERLIHPFLQNRPQILMSAFGHGDSTDLAFFSKPPIGSSYEADFAVLNYDQGGCQVTLI